MGYIKVNLSYFVPRIFSLFDLAGVIRNCSVLHYPRWMVFIHDARIPSDRFRHSKNENCWQLGEFAESTVPNFIITCTSSSTTIRLDFWIMLPPTARPITTFNPGFRPFFFFSSIPLINSNRNKRAGLSDLKPGDLGNSLPGEEGEAARN